LHNRVGTAGVWIARSGITLALVPVLASLALGRSELAVLQLVALSVAALGMAVLAAARRHEGDLPGRLLELTLAGTLLGTAAASHGGCLLAGAGWLLVAAVLWGAYVSPAVGRPAAAARG
jgi:hypothetical protein